MDVNGQFYAQAGLLLLPEGQEVWWAPDLVWTQRQREKNPIIAPAGNWTPVVQPVAKSLYWLSYHGL
jgi:hypothetical protein